MERLEKEIRLDVTELKKKLITRQRVQKELLKSKTRDLDQVKIE